MWGCCLAAVSPRSFCTGRVSDLRQKKAFRNASLQSKAAYPVGFLLPLQNASEARVLALTECVGADDSVGLKNVANSPQIFEKTLRSAGGQCRPPLQIVFEFTQIP